MTSTRNYVPSLLIIIRLRYPRILVSERSAEWTSPSDYHFQDLLGSDFYMGFSV